MLGNKGPSPLKVFSRSIYFVFFVYLKNLCDLHCPVLWYDWLILLPLNTWNVFGGTMAFQMSSVNIYLQETSGTILFIRVVHYQVKFTNKFHWIYHISILMTFSSIWETASCSHLAIVAAAVFNKRVLNEEHKFIPIN